jgi:hypothetical protein
VLKIPNGDIGSRTTQRYGNFSMYAIGS